MLTVCVHFGGNTEEVSVLEVWGLQHPGLRCGTCLVLELLFLPQNPDDCDWTLTPAQWDSLHRRVLSHDPLLHICLICLMFMQMSAGVPTCVWS